MSGERIGCVDNSCIFKILRPAGVGTNGGCQCFEDLVAWVQTGNDASEGRWNRQEVRKVQQDTRRLAAALSATISERDNAMDNAKWQQRNAQELGKDISAIVGVQTTDGDVLRSAVARVVEERDALRAQVERVRAMLEDFDCGHGPNDCPDDCPLVAVEQALEGK